MVNSLPSSYDDPEPLIPTSIDEIHVEKPDSLALCLIAELVPDLDTSQFVFIPCPWFHSHYFQLHDGEGDALSIGCWVLRCPGPLGALLRNDGVQGERCLTQYGQYLPVPLARKLLELRDYYKKHANVALTVAQLLRKLDSAMAIYYSYSLEQRLPLPEKAAAWISKSTSSFRSYIDTTYSCQTGRR